MVDFSRLTEIAMNTDGMSDTAGTYTHGTTTVTGLSFVLREETADFETQDGVLIRGQQVSIGLRMSDLAEGSLTQPAKGDRFTAGTTWEVQNWLAVVEADRWQLDCTRVET